MGARSEGPKTKTLPEGQRGAWLEYPDVIESLQVFRTSIEYPLPANVEKFTLGSGSDCDVVLQDPSVSRHHCTLARRGSVIRVTDQGSYNGTFFAGRRETSFDVRPGDVFTVAGTRLLAMDGGMRTQYPALIDLLGDDAEQTALPRMFAPADLLLTAQDADHLLLVGEEGCGQEVLAEIIHSVSLRRERDMLTITVVPADRNDQRVLIDQGSRSTVRLMLDERSPVMDATFASSLFSPSYSIRVIVVAPSTSKALAVLGESLFHRLRVIELRPLWLRTTALPRLLDRRLGERGSPLHFGSDCVEPEGIALVSVAQEHRRARARRGSLDRADGGKGLAGGRRAIGDASRYAASLAYTDRTGASADRGWRLSRRVRFGTIGLEA